MTPDDIDFSDSNFVDDILKNCNILRTRAMKAEASLADAEALIKKNAELINGFLARIAELESQLAEYRKPVESMDTDQLSQWNVELSTLLCMPVSDRENLWWQIAVGDHLEKFAQSWHSSRITELESQILHQTEISACRIEERERLQKQITALQEIAIEAHAKNIYPYTMPDWDRLPDNDFQEKIIGSERITTRAGKNYWRVAASNQLRREHPEAFQ